ncbi:uncharacterized protein LOC113499986 [Trichoplusia ni]|uniref:Uncharacterized protein LOC113499986 n=1 Tax=Trichoplusia ni TaxID=7111 RepID=A0A7E5W7F0_TRINI|nr:uncharacterized protein LOC113499986 [Trichoplusia ni]
MLIRYSPNIVVISCQDFSHFEEMLLKVITTLYWNPLANVIIYYQKYEERENIAKIFFALWYHKAINAIIVQYDDLQETMIISDYTPYITNSTSMKNLFGCWTARKISLTVLNFQEGIVCVEKCHNVTIHSELRAFHLGTCIGFNKRTVLYKDVDILKSVELFTDRSKNYNGFMFRAYTTEVEPFFIITADNNGSFTIGARDGIIWNTMSKLMNFGIDLSPSLDVMKKPFDFELNIEQIFAFSRRKGDLYLIPIYIFDIILVEIDFTFPYKESGVCIMSNRAGFNTSFIDVGDTDGFQASQLSVWLGIIGMWITFTLYKWAELGRLTFNQVGKDFLNTVRNILSLNLCNPPKRNSFRIFLTITTWSIFVINFSTQAKIISFLTAAKRGQEIETFEDVIEKGYPIQGMSSPDLILPETEEKFQIINQRLIPSQDIFGCVKRMTNDSHRFCLIDCAIGRYLERNRLNEKGEQYLHIAKKDRMHSHYLNMLLPKHSPMTNRFNKYMMMFVEAGLIKKWEQYRYTDIKQEATMKPLGMNEINVIFQIYVSCVGFTCIIFLVEIIMYNVNKMVNKYSKSKKMN